MSGVTPEVVEVPDDDGPTTPAIEEPDDPEPDADDEPAIQEVDLTGDDFGGSGGLFSGDEEAESGPTADPSTSEGDGPASSAGGDSGDDSDDSEPFAFGDDSKAGQLESAINNGAARLAVVGLDDDEAADLEAEFSEVFEAFRLGYFGAECVEEYVLVEDEDVSPAWGLLGTAICCMAFALYMRPDGDEKLADMREAIGSLSNGVKQGVGR